MSATKIVKRYANRKLYDTERSCYVTLEDISLMIKMGEDVRVVDNKTGEDLTSVTLAQIIFEAEKKKNFMPMGLLRDLIRDSGDTIGGLAREGVDRVQATATEFRETADKLRKDTVETADRLRRDTVETAEKFRKDTVETAEKLTSELRDRLDSVISRSKSGDEKSSETTEKANILLDMVKNSQKSFDDLQQGVEELFKDGVGAVSRHARLDKDMDEISERLASLEERLGKMQ